MMFEKVMIDYFNSFRNLVVVRTIPASLSTRYCLREDISKGRRYIWVASGSDKSSYPMSTRKQIDYLASSCDQNAFPYFCFPSRSHHFSIWSNFEHSGLLFDKLFLNKSYDNTTLSENSAKIAQMFAGLHSLKLDFSKFNLLPHPIWSIQLASNSDLTAHRRRLKAGLVASLENTNIPSVRWSDKQSLIHGLANSSYIIPNSNPIVMGWEYCGIGNPTYDISHLIADYIEAAAVASNERREEILDGCLILTHGYIASVLPPIEPIDLISCTIERIVDHMVMSIARRKSFHSEYRLAKCICEVLPTLLERISK